MAAFVNDKRPAAYDRLVDRFLADPAFGERWARPWLDLARYADSAGYASDPLRTIWLYRDWVIDAFNADMPFDEFTIEQLAGDLLPKPTPDQLDRHRLQPQHDDEHRRRHRRRRVPRRRRQGPRRHYDGRLDGPHHRLRQVPQPQVRPDHAEGVLPVRGDFQSVGRQRSARRIADDLLPLARNGPRSGRHRRPHRRPQKTLKRGEGQKDDQKADRRLAAVQAASADRPRHARAADRKAPQDARDDQR